MIRVATVYVSDSTRTVVGTESVVAWDPMQEQGWCTRCECSECIDTRALAYAVHVSNLDYCAVFDLEGLEFDVRRLAATTAHEVLDSDAQFRRWCAQTCRTSPAIRAEAGEDLDAEDHCPDCGAFDSECVCPDEAPPPPPECPTCGAPMVARRRYSDGSPFWGCTTFPLCKGTRNTFLEATPRAQVVTPPPSLPPAGLVMHWGGPATGAPQFGPQSDRWNQPIEQELQAAANRAGDPGAAVRDAAGRLPPAARCTRVSCTKPRLEGRAFCAEHEPSATPRAPVRPAGPHGSHALDGARCRYCGGSGTVLLNPCGRSELGRIGMIELD